MNSISSVATKDPISALAAPRKKGADKTGEDFESLQKALDSGDLAAAKTAFSTLQANLKSAPPPPDGESAAVSAAAKQGPDLSALAKALDSGDLSAAKTALTDIQKKRQHKADAVGAANAVSADAFLASLSGSNTGATASVGTAATASRDPFGVSGQSLDIRA